MSKLRPTETWNVAELIEFMLFFIDNMGVEYVEATNAMCFSWRTVLI